MNSFVHQMNTQWEISMTYPTGWTIHVGDVIMVLNAV